MAIDITTDIETSVNDALERLGIRITITPISAAPGDAPDWTNGMTPYLVTISRNRRRMTINYYTGSAITNDPTATDIVSVVSSDYYIYRDCETLESFANEYHGWSATTYKTWKLLERQGRNWLRVLGDDDAVKELARLVEDY